MLSRFVAAFGARRHAPNRERSHATGIRSLELTGLTGSDGKRDVPDHRIGVVIPVYNEAELIGGVLNSLLVFVNSAYVVDDCSTDRSWEVIRRRATVSSTIASSTPDEEATPEPRLVPIRHEENKGRGAAVKTGYAEALLTLLTRVASGYWGMTDPQNGYTAISAEALELLELEGLYDDYGFLNDVLVRLNVQGARIVDISVRARYGDEESGIRYKSFVPALSLLLLHRFLWRLTTSRGNKCRPEAPLYGLAMLVGVSGVCGVALAVAGGLTWDVGITAVIAFVATTALGMTAVVTDRWYNHRFVIDFELDQSAK